MNEHESDDVIDPMIDAVINEICSILFAKRIDSRTVDCNSNYTTISVIIDYCSFCYLTFYDTFIGIGGCHYLTHRHVCIDYNDPKLFDKVFMNIREFLGPKYDQYE